MTKKRDLINELIGKDGFEDLLVHKLKRLSIKELQALIVASDKKEMRELVKFKSFFNKWKSWKRKNYKNQKVKENVKLLLGDGIKKIQPNEYITINSQKKSLYAKKKIKKGELFTKNNICVKGPVSGLMPKYLDIVIGRTAKKDIDLDHPITWTVI